ncbi:MAG: 4-(cytidine 5'-diphospho)-2-C-methyl-D-erythritol kinase [Candidatus Zixiibacteriota bacterium]|nr:MAG: 4-(cytidine 5'-diphospho)-2-C-methyl-D-erythritol kinase [candidate division Zixibacteria bacterium]
MADRSVTIDTPAKINLFLKILGKRPDGYHEIYSLVQTVDLYDTLTISDTTGGTELISAATTVPLDSSNIIWKAVELLRRQTGFTQGIRVNLTKRIPVGAGLGGGSSDAAATLKGVTQLLDLNLSRQQLQQLGATLGSDVPFFFSTGSAIISGRGEMVEEVKIASDYNVLLVVPDFAISTADAYGRVKINLTNSSPKPTFIREKISAELLPLLDQIGNDFEGLVTDGHPAVASCMQFLREAGARVVALSGSGSAFFGLFERTPDPSLATMISGRFGWQVFSLCPVKLA